MYANPNANLRKYQSDSIMTASPMELIIMLYDALIKEMKLAEIFIEQRDFWKTHKHLIKAQDIVTELTRGLDMRYEISDQLMQLYDFMTSELIAANLTKDAQSLPALIDIASELREAWLTVKSTANARPYVIEE